MYVLTAGALSGRKAGRGCLRSPDWAGRVASTKMKMKNLVAVAGISL